MDKMNIPFVHSFVLKAFGLVISMVAIMQNANYYALCGFMLQNQLVQSF
jgi:hypothetical protein